MVLGTFWGYYNEQYKYKFCHSGAYVLLGERGNNEINK